jgi:hypothetical protein
MTHAYIVSLLPGPIFAENHLRTALAFYWVFAALCHDLGRPAHPTLSQLLSSVPRCVAVLFPLALLATTIASVLIAAMGTHFLYFPCALARCRGDLGAALPAHVALHAALAAPYLCVVTTGMACVYPFFVGRRHYPIAASARADTLCARGTRADFALTCLLLRRCGVTPYSHIYISTYIHKNIHACMHTYIHTYCVERLWHSVTVRSRMTYW